MHIDAGDAERAYEAGAAAMRILETYGGTIEGEALIFIGYAEGLRGKGDIEGSKKAIARGARSRCSHVPRRSRRPSFAASSWSACASTVAS